MRTTLFFLPILFSLAASAQSPKHEIDGVATEWKDASFVTLTPEGQAVATANDDHFLYVAIKVPDLRSQLRLARTGMKLLIDPKGRDRDQEGISFPYNNNGFQRTESEGAPTLADVQDQVAKSMMMYRTFGFEDQQEPRTVLLSLAPGDIQLGAAWDDKNALVIEYAIPIEKLGDARRLAGKPISVGVCNSAIERTQDGAPAQQDASTTQLAAVPRGGSPSGRSSMQNGRSNSLSSADSRMDQGFRRGSAPVINWTKYTFTR